jgi:isopentenyl-diphosphate delta-isomerase
VSESEEKFEIFSETGEQLGLAPRSRVHRLGLWHRSAQVFLFDRRGRLLLQRRSSAKDVCPGLWDQSVAEHLKPGETYLDGARRGLAEELDVHGVALAPLGAPDRARLDEPSLGIRDYEFIQTFSGHYDGPVRVDPAEVAEVRTVTLEVLAAWLEEHPDRFTPWFRRNVIRCDVLAGD